LLRLQDDQPPQPEVLHWMSLHLQAQ
jgi:hypothetical protein